MTSRLAGIAALWLLALGLAAGAQTLPGESVGIVLSRGKPIVPVHLNGVGPYAFMLDVGLARPVVDRTVAAYLAVPASASEEQPAVLSYLQVGAFGVTGPAVSVDDLSRFEPLAGVGVQGLLPGRLGLGHLTVDFPGETLSFGPPPDAEQSFSANIALDSGELWVDLLLDSKHLRRSRLDTTYGGVLSLPAEFAMKLGLVGPDTPRLQFEKPQGDAPGLETETQVRLHAIAVGGAEMLDPPCALLESGDCPVVGTGFLRHFRVTFDFEGGKVYLAKAERGPVKGEPFTGYGLVLGGRDGGYWTVYTAVNGPAYRNGVKSGDRIAAVDGQPRKDAPYAEIAARLVAEPGTIGRFSFLRGERTRDVELTAERVF
jgi:hypothetical protein